MNLGHSFSRTLWSEVFQRFFPDSSEGVHEKPTILRGQQICLLNTEDQRRFSMSIAGNFGEVLQTKQFPQAKNAHQNQIKCNEGYQIRMLKTSILLTGFLIDQPSIRDLHCSHHLTRWEWWTGMITDYSANSYSWESISIALKSSLGKFLTFISPKVLNIVTRTYHWMWNTKVRWNEQWLYKWILIHLWMKLKKKNVPPMSKTVLFMSLLYNRQSSPGVGKSVFSLINLH